MSEKENWYIKDFRDKLEMEKKNALQSIERDRRSIAIEKEKIAEIDVALERLKLKEETDDESDDKVMEAVEEKFEGNRERFD